MMHALTFAEQLVASLDLTEAPDCLLLLAAGFVVDVGDWPAGPAAAADCVVLAQRTMPFLLAPLERLQGAALERYPRILGLDDAQIIDEVIHLVQRHGVAGEEARYISPPARSDRVVNELALPDPVRDCAVLGLRARDRIPQRLLTRRDIVGRGEKVMRLQLGQIGRRVLLVERAALRRDEVPAPQVRLIPTRRRRVGQLAD